MFSIAINTELGALMLFVIFSLIAANKASKLIYYRTEKELHKRTRKMVFWTVSLTVLAATMAAADIFLALNAHPLLWLDRLLLRTPLAFIGVLFVWFGAMPRVRMLLARTRMQTDAVPDLSRRRQATEPLLVAPYQFAALIGAGLFYFAFVPPIPFAWTYLTIPLTLLTVLACFLWMLQSHRNRKATESMQTYIYRPWGRRLRLTGTYAAIAAVCSVPLLTAMQGSKLPDRLNMMTGKPDYGMAAAAAGHNHHQASDPVLASAAVPVTELTGPQSGKADRKFALTAKKKSVQLSSGKTVDAWTYNGQIPGPEIRVKKGQLVEVTLLNEDIEGGVTLHWHGLDVPNAEDGVAGATQNAVMPGGKHTYRFMAEQVGTFWYHSHQNSKEAVQKGLFGALIVEPDEDTHAEAYEDITIMTHVWDDAGMAIGADDTLQSKAIAPGTPVRLRLINTDDWVRQSYSLTGTTFQVAAIDGTDLHEPGDLNNQRLELITGGRYDVTFIMPDHPVLLSVGRGKKLGLLMSPDGKGEPPAIPQTTVFDPTHYGTAAKTPFGQDSKFDREFTMILDNRFAFYNGGFAAYDTINGQVFPNTPMFVVRENELVKTTIVNRSSVDHPMHLHGHHMLVLSRNGEDVTGSPWWSDTLDVAPGEVYEVAFLADNPGLWMDHCHNLKHAAAGMTMHLMYEGVISPFEVGTETHNHPE
ncbi:multicopper oxidase family protein [Paenibacillus harenae]|uniref:FtsP/CotA-like multicopper oxidase with cupredoxin domain n=1 Tax=Paenibacillus harenae TaxID=306543 RepID=A0ABT9U1D3_PAEHA|nr:multicopper oxidase family protein [Paenibacillus harenae]MDQ0113445.1 FtsP/CotA-like multicopper oxidase with cupredoxin domain [Paenibacillus harenae]